MQITVVGTGYVGLVVGACLADMGNDVICVDNNEEKLAKLKNGIIPIYEPGLEELVKTNVQENRLIFSKEITSAVKKSKVCFIAVGTPQGEDGSADLKYVYEVAKSIGEAMNNYKVIVNKSTVPVGTANKISQIIKNCTKEEFDIVSNPEFLKQGHAVDDFLAPDRVIIGANSEKAKKIMNEIYSPFIRTTNKIIFMDINSAEMTKYASNSFLATKISFMNEMANLCEKVGADIEKVRIGMSCDTRIGDKFLFAGVGYGGSCFPKDVRALIKTGDEFNCNMNIIKAVEETNQNQIKLFTNKILNYFNNDVSNKNIAIWGLSFKPKTNDMRFAPSIKLINSLIENGANISAYDPKAMDEAKRIIGDRITYANCAYETLDKADCLVLLTEWNEFRRPDFNKIKNLMNKPIIFDGRNQYDINILKNFGFEYYSIGR